MNDANATDVPWADTFWRGRRVLVTGHTGFKGPWLCRSLVRAGADVMGYSLPAPTEPSLFHLLGLADDIGQQLGDVRDLDGLRGCVASFRPEIVFHLAAQSLVLESYQDPVGTFSTNVMGTVNLLEAVRVSPDVVACIVVTSDKCYEPTDSPRAHKEDDPLGGVDAYSASKGCAEIVTAAYRRALLGESQGRVASARAGNVIGGGDWSADRLIPDIVRALTTETPLELRRPEAVRPWQHVLEPIGGYLTLAKGLASNPALAGGWNFGPSHDDVWTVRRVVTEFAGVWGDELAANVTLAQSNFVETGYLALDSQKAHAQLGWEPRWSVSDAIVRTAEWYHALYVDGATATALVDTEIDAYARAPGVVAGGAASE